MGKPPPKFRRKLTATQVARLRRERQRLSKQLATVDSKLARHAGKPKRRKERVLTVEEFDRLLDELSEGLDHLPPLPSDWSRADLYDDHD